MSNTTDNFTLDYTQGNETIQKSTYVGGAHRPHVIAELPDDHPYLKAHTQWLLGGGDGTASDLGSGETLTAAPADFTPLNTDQGHLFLEITNASGTIDVDVNMNISADGITTLGSEDGIIEAKTANGLYGLPLASLAHNHFPIFEVVETAGAGGSCDVRLVIMARGG